MRICTVRMMHENRARIGSCPRADKQSASVEFTLWPRSDGTLYIQVTTLIFEQIFSRKLNLCSLSSTLCTDQIGRIFFAHKSAPGLYSYVPMDS